MNYTKTEQLYEGKAKKVYKTTDPETAGIRRNFVGQDDGAVTRFSIFKFKINQLDIDFFEIITQNLIDFEGIVSNGFQLFGCSEVHGKNVIIIDHWVAERIVFIAVL